MTRPSPLDDSPERKSWIFSKTGLATAGFLAAIGFLMATGHTAHLLGFAPYLLLLACPLMHIFMHHGHGGHHHGHGGMERPDAGPSAPQKKDW